MPLSYRAYTERTAASVWNWYGTALSTSREADEWVSAYMGRPCKLLRFDLGHEKRETLRQWAPGYAVTFNDLFSYMIISEASVRALNEHLPEPITYARFRPNIVVDGSEPFEEDTWRAFIFGKKKQVVFRGVKPRGRCKITTVNPETAQVGDQPLKLLSERRSGKDLNLPRELAREVNFGIDVVCESSSWLTPVSGQIALDDVVTVIDRCESAAELPYSIIKAKKAWAK